MLINVLIGELYMPYLQKSKKGNYINAVLVDVSIKRNPKSFASSVAH